MIKPQDKTYNITPMMEDFPVSATQVVNFTDLMKYVSAYNKGTLGHCDAWFSIFDLEDVEHEISDFYQYLDDGEK